MISKLNPPRHLRNLIISNILVLIVRTTQKKSRMTETMAKVIKAGGQTKNIRDSLKVFTNSGKIGILFTNMSAQDLAHKLDLMPRSTLTKLFRRDRIRTTFQMISSE